MSHIADPLELRPFTLEDANAVAPWLCGPGLSVPRRNAWPQRLLSDQRIVASVAFSGAERVGLVRLDCGPDGVADVTLVVAPDHRRCGYGRRMFELALQRAREVGMRGLVAYIDLNNEPATAFFEEVGFDAAGVAGSRLRMERVVHAGGSTVPPLDVSV